MLDEKLPEDDSMMKQHDSAAKSIEIIKYYQAGDEATDPDRRADIIIDSTFSLIYTVCFIAVIAIATRNFLRFPRSVNKANILIVILLSLTLLSKCYLTIYQSY